MTKLIECARVILHNIINLVSSITKTIKNVWNVCGIHYNRHIKERGIMIDWFEVEGYIRDAKGIAFDTCHKIYILMDDEQMAKMKEYEYDPLISKAEMSAGEMFETIKHWYAESCGLKFVEAVTTTPDGVDPNEGFETLIEQGAKEYDDCVNCGDEDCDGWDCQRERCENCGYDDVYEDDLCRDCYDDSQEEED